MRSPRLLIILGSLLAMLAVIAGAFGAHLLKHRLDADQLEAFHTAARYQMYHALALLLLAALMPPAPIAPAAPAASLSGALLALSPRLLAAAAWMFLIGTILFSGSLYGLSLLDGDARPLQRWLGPITPLGGLLLILGWATLATAAITSRTGVRGR